MLVSWCKDFLSRGCAPAQRRSQRPGVRDERTTKLAVEMLECRQLLSAAPVPEVVSASDPESAASPVRNTISAVVGDFNGDGKGDVAVVSGNGVSVLLGNGTGGFAAPVAYNAGNVPSFVEVGDFNGDGKRDLVVANPGGVGVLLGNGASGFGAFTSFPAGANPQSLAVGDFNGDGKPDLAVVNAGGVSILLGNGAGGFATAVTYGAGNSPVSVAVADFNRDGKQDLAVVNGGGVSVLLGIGAGGFTAPLTYAASTAPTCVATGDFNGDGKPDLAVATASGACVLLGNGAGGFAAPVLYTAGSSPSFLAVADFNSDGRLDIAVTNAAGISVLLGTGAGGFAAPVTFRAGNSPASLAVGDFNGDGKPDLVADGAGGVAVLAGNGTGSFGPPITFSVGSGNNSGSPIPVIPSEASTTTLTVLPVPFATGESVTLSATVSGPGGLIPFLGAVQFLDGTTLLGTRLLLSGTATLHMAFPPGQHALTAAYLGGGSFIASTSATVSEVLGDVNERFVAQVYHDLLGRQVDPSGLSFWTGQLAAGTLGTTEVVLGVEASQEFRSAEVNSAYQAVLGRPADTDGLNTFMRFLADGGTVEQIKIALAGSQEFSDASQDNANPNATNSAQRVVDSLFMHFLNRHAETGALLFFGHQLDSGTSSATVASEILSTTDGLAAAVNGLYGRLVHRPADGDGLDFWVAGLGQGKVRDEDLILALATSGEYVAAV